MGRLEISKLAENQPTTLEFHLTPATCKISGTVKDANGKPLSGEVLLLKAGIVVQKTISDAKTGYYEFPAVPDRYEVLPVMPGHIPRGWSGAVAADVKADFSLTPVTETEEERQRRFENR